jgi:hypothetical protein
MTDAQRRFEKLLRETARRVAERAALEQREPDEHVGDLALDAADDFMTTMPAAELEALESRSGCTSADTRSRR